VLGGGVLGVAAAVLAAEVHSVVVEPAADGNLIR